MAPVSVMAVGAKSKNKLVTYDQELVKLLNLKIVENQKNISFIIGCSHSFSKSWIVHQLYDEKTLENYGKILSLDHFLPIASFNLLDENDVKSSFNWINLRPINSIENNLKKAKIVFHLYLPQEVKANYFVEINA